MTFNTSDINICESPVLKSVAHKLKDLNVTIEEKDYIIFELLKDYYTEIPASPIEFITNPYYLGSVSKTLFPIWKDTFLKIYPSRFFSPYYLIILQAAIGAGKSAILSSICLYELHKHLCMKNPSAFYGLQHNEVLYFLFYTFKKQIAEDGNWIQFLNMLLASDYFSERISPPATPYAGQLTPNLAVRVVSLSNDLVSKAVVFAGMDEFNEKKHKSSSNTQVYHEMLRRMDSRLMDSSGNQPYKLVVASSPKDESDELGRVIDKIKNLKLTNECLIVEGVSAMDTSGLRLRYSGEKFLVYVDANNSYIMESREDIRTKEFNPEQIYEVPIEYLKSFQLDVIGSIREILGIRIGSTSRFFREPRVLESSLSRPNACPDTLVIPFNIGYEAGVELLLNNINLNFSYPFALRCIHVDTATKGDRLGFTCSMVMPLQANFSLSSIVRDDIFKNAIFMSDFSIGIETADGQEIPLDVISGVICKFRDLGLRIHKVTWDSYQSSAIHQPLERNHIANEYQSVDTPMDAYLMLKRAMLSGRYIGVKNDVAIEEGKNLLKLAKKVDHPADSSKDIMDSIAGSFFSCYKDLDILLQDYNIHAIQSSSHTAKRALVKAGFKQIGK